MSSLLNQGSLNITQLKLTATVPEKSVVYLVDETATTPEEKNLKAYVDDFVAGAAYVPGARPADTVGGAIDGAAKKSELAAPTGAGEVGTILPLTGAKPINLNVAMSHVVNVHKFGAICDGTSRPLSTIFGTLSAAQAEYPSARSLTDELDTVATQLCLDNLRPGMRLDGGDQIYTNRTLYLNKENVVWEASGSEFVLAPGVRFSLVVHGGVINRDLTGSAWTNQLLEMAYETTTPLAGVKIFGLKSRTAGLGALATQMLALFCDDAEFDVEVENSDGNGLNLWQCVRPKVNRLKTNKVNAYSLFVYQCYGVDLGLLDVANGGRVYSIKQRHKFSESNNHYLRRVIAKDMVGFDDPAWATGGDSFNDMVRDGMNATIIANRNFTGHEINRGMTIDQVDFRVTPSASGAVVAPSLHMGCFADKVRIKRIDFDANGKTATTSPIIMGARGDIAFGQAGGATFGKGHVIESFNFQNYQNTGVEPVIQFGVDSSVLSTTSQNNRVGVLAADAAVALMPFGSIDTIEMPNITGDIDLFMGAVGDRGVAISANTRKFVSGAWRLKAKPVNLAANNTLSVVRVAAPLWEQTSRDEIETIDGGAGASNHTTTFPVSDGSISGRTQFKVTGMAPTAFRGISLTSTATTKNKILAPCEVVLTNTPSGEKTGILTTGEVNNLGGHIYTGPLSTTLSTADGKNAQNLRPTVFLAAAPTTGTWPSGGIQEALALSRASPISRRKGAGGAPGAFYVDSVAMFSGSTAQRPVLGAPDFGVPYFDTTLAAAGKPIWWTGTAWVDANGAVV